MARILRAAAACLVAALAAEGRAAPVEVIISYGDGQPSAVNERGQVVGCLYGPERVSSRAFSWTQASGVVDLGTLGGAWSRAELVNGSGQVVGRSSRADGSVGVFSWTRDRGIVDLGTLGGRECWPAGLTEAGQVVGTCTLVGELARHAFSWTQSEGMIDLGTLGGMDSYAVAVNASGQVAGSSHPSDGDSLHAFSWTRDGGMIDLVGTLGTFSPSEPVAINDLGQIAGSGYAGPGGWQAFSWTKDGGLIGIEKLVPGGALPVAVTSSGQVVGWNGDRAWSWTAGGSTIDVGTLGGSFMSVTDVSASGHVVGSSVDADGQTHGFVWTQADGLVALGTVGHGVYAGPLAVNASGQVVGGNGAADGMHAFSWTKAGGIVDLTPAHADWYWSWGELVTDGGRVVGSAWALSDPAQRVVTWKTDPVAELGLLIEATEDLRLPFGLTTSLTSKLADGLAALAAGDRATSCALLTSFINATSAQAAKKKLTAVQAEALVVPAADVRAMLECP